MEKVLLAEIESEAENPGRAHPGDEPNLDKEDFIFKAMRRAFDPYTNTVADLSLDTSEFELAENVYDFCNRVAGKSIKMLFARQLWLCYMLFSEWCPRCSDPTLVDISALPVDEEPAESLDSGRLTLFKHGVCPKCSVTRTQCILRGELNDYNALVLAAGQRGGKSATSSVIAAYHLHLMLKAPRLSTICRGIMEFTPLSYTFVGLSSSRSIRNLWNPFHEILKNAEWFCLSKGTAIELADGTNKPIEEIQVGDSVVTFQGANLVEKVFDNGVKDCLELELASGKKLTGTKEHLIQCLSEDGNSLVWKPLGELTENDYVVQA